MSSNNLDTNSGFPTGALAGYRVLDLSDAVSYTHLTLPTKA